MEKLVAWQGRDNITWCRFKKDSGFVTPDQLKILTKIGVKFKDQAFNSENSSDCFDLVSRINEGEIGIRFGLLPFSCNSNTAGQCFCLFYDDETPHGVVVMPFILVIRVDAKPIG